MVSPSSWRVEGKAAGAEKRGGNVGRVEKRLLPGRSADGGVSDKENGVCENGFTLREKGSWGSAKGKMPIIPANSY